MLINRGGSPGGIIALYFDGAVNYFSELPRADDPKIQSVYKSLQGIRVKKVAKAFFFSYEINKMNKELHRWKIFHKFAALFK